jgi:EAL and modified HD-GYP domain-containing signal transduction protein
MSPEALTQDVGTETRYIARQPILDLDGRVHGYALLFDTGADGVIQGRHRDAARTILDDLVLFGLDRLTGGLPAFIRCTAEALIEEQVAVLPPATSILDIPESIKVCPRLIESCRKLKQAGFRISLVDFTAPEELHPLLEFADYVKVNLTSLDPAAQRRLHEQLAGRDTALVADKVDTQEGYRIDRAAGSAFFQGLYFCYPQLIKNGKIPPNRIFHAEILRQLQNDPLDLKKISPLVMRDAALVLRLLRLVNSPLCAIRQQVQSIESAIMILGENTFRRIANLAILRELNGDQPAELMHMALVRARFCQLSAAHCQLDASEQYLVGMLSLLPAMLGYAMDSLVRELPLSDEVRRALLGEPSRERCLLSWIEAHERNETHECYDISTKFNLNEQKLNQFYVDALMWDAAIPRAVS